MIIDEISMVSYQMFTFIHKCLTEIKGTDDTEIYFGGISIIAVGDFFQLQPVRDQFVFQDGKGHVQGATHLWRNLFTVFELTTNMCQRNDITYSEVLNHIRTGSHPPDNIQLLRLRLTSGVLNPVSLTDGRFRGALRLLPRKVQVEEYNDQCLQKLATTSTVYDFKAEHAIPESRFLPAGVSSGSVPEHLIPKEDRDCAGLRSTSSLQPEHR